MTPSVFSETKALNANTSQNNKWISGINGSHLKFLVDSLEFQGLCHIYIIFYKAADITEAQVKIIPFNLYLFFITDIISSLERI